jgi:quercetin dioxygenase-like cupin family protein
MISEQQQEQASLYVLGAMPADEQRAFEARIKADSELRALVLDLQRSTALMAAARPSAALPSSLKAKVMGRIGEAASGKATATTSPRYAPGFEFHGSGDERGWKQLPVRGAWIKLLSLEKDRGYAVLLGRLEPGVRYPAHEHLGSEQLFIISGDLHIGARALGPGDFHHADAGTAHGVNYSEQGCTLLAVLPAEHELVQFAMA